MVVRRRRSTWCSARPPACTASGSIAARTCSAGCRTCARPCCAWFGANYLGAVHVPLNTGYRGRLLQHAIALSDADVLVVHASLLPRLDEVDTARLRDVIVVGGALPPAGRLRFHEAAVLDAPGSGRARATRRALGHELPDVHVRHHGPVEGRDLHVPAELVGRRHGHGLLRRGRPPAREPAAVSRERRGSRHGSPDQGRHLRAATTASSRAASGTRCVASRSRAAAWSAR